jgi:hypothetical protein
MERREKEKWSLTPLPLLGREQAGKEKSEFFFLLSADATWLAKAIWCKLRLELTPVKERMRDEERSDQKPGPFGGLADWSGKMLNQRKSCVLFFSSASNNSSPAPLNLIEYEKRPFPR